MTFRPDRSWSILIPTAPIWVPLALILVAVLTVARKLGVYRPKPT